MRIAIRISISVLSVLVVLSTLIIDSYAIEETIVDGSRNLATLAQKWNISDTEFSYTGLQFSLNYTVSDFILDSMVTYEVYDRDCQEGNVAVSESVLETSLQPDRTTPGVGDDFRKTSIVLSLNASNIANEQSLYSEETVGGELVATVEFCVRFGLWTPTTPSIEVNFLETVVTLLVDLTAGFDIDAVTVKPKEKLLNTASDSYSVDGYLCNQQNAPLSEEEALETRSQGSVIRVCVRPDEEARGDGVYMRAILSFRFTRDPDQNPPVVQVAIKDREEAENNLTSLDCEAGMLVCAFESILFAAFYRVPGMVEGTGSAIMQFGDGTATETRRLGSPRILQDDTTTGEALFDIDVDLLPSEDGFDQSDASIKVSSVWLVTMILSLLMATIL